MFHCPVIHQRVRAGSITLAWDDLIHQQITTSDGDSAFFRIDQVSSEPATPTGVPVNAPAARTWSGWQHRTLNVGDRVLLGQVENYNVEPSDVCGVITSRESVRFRLRTGDYSHEPAFVLESFAVALDDGDAGVITVANERQGLRLKTSGRAAVPDRTVLAAPKEMDCPLNAILPAAVPVLAAAMPHERARGLRSHC